MTNQIQFDLPKIGLVTMKGHGPWKVYRESGHSQIVLDVDGREANPFVQSNRRNSANVVFANLADVEAVVAKANELFAAK